MDKIDIDRALRRAELVVKVNRGKEAFAEEVNMARVLLVAWRLVGAHTAEDVRAA